MLLHFGHIWYMQIAVELCISRTSFIFYYLLCSSSSSSSSSSNNNNATYLKLKQSTLLTSGIWL